MRHRGTGTIETLSDGRARPRMPGHGARLETCETREEAQRLLAAALEQEAVRPSNLLTFGAYGRRVLEARETAGQRAARSYLSSWATHVERCWLGDVELRVLTRGDVVAWTKELATRRRSPGNKHSAAEKERRAKQVIAKSTAQNALNAVRIVLTEAVDDDLLEENPADGVRLPTAIRKRRRRDTGWSYFDEDEVRALLSADVPDFDRLAIAFDIGTGAREAELWNIRWRDIDLERATVALRMTKSGEPRIVQMTPLAVEAVRAWREIAPSTAATKHVWTSARGHARRGEPDRWDDYLDRAGLVAEQRRDGRKLRFHDLRHTCATALLQGWWGAPWTLEAVQEQLGHASRTTTERYAHLVGSLASRAADAMRDRPIHRPTTPRERLAEVLGILAAPPARVERTTNGLGNLCLPKRSHRGKRDHGLNVGRSSSLPGLARAVRSLAERWDALEKAAAE